MKRARITRRRGWGWLLLCLVWLGGCHPHYALQRTLSPLGYAWFGDLLRLRSIYRSVPPRLTADRWRRSVTVTVKAIHRHARRHKWTKAQELQRLLRFAQELTRASIAAKEPYARWAVVGIFLPWKARASIAWPFLLGRVDDPHPLVRRQALRALFALVPPEKILQQATHRALTDPHYWVRANFFFALLPALMVPSHPLHAYATEGMIQCVSGQTSAPLGPSLRYPPKLTPPAMLLRLRRHCLRALTYAKEGQREKAKTFLQKLARQADPLQGEAKTLLIRMKETR